MFKYILCFSVCFFVIVSPAIADLSPQDLKEIRLIVKEEIERVIEKELTPIKADIATMKVDIVSLKEGFARLDERLNSVDKQFESIGKRIDSVERQVTMVANLTYALIALIVLAVGIPQVIMMWRDRRDSTLEAQIAALTQEVEKLKQQ